MAGIDQVDRRRQIMVRPVEVVHAKALQRAGARQADATIVDRKRRVALRRGVLGKAAIETLGHAGRAGHNEVAAQRTHRDIALRREWVSVARRERQPLGGGRARSRGAVHGP